MFHELAEILKNSYPKERLLLVGFAETATAIGAEVAAELGSRYIQTTREVIEDAEYIFFSEEHSHATQQKLVKNDHGIIIHKVDRIIFIEDEVTTGKTIRNMIEVLSKTGIQKEYHMRLLLCSMEWMRPRCSFMKKRGYSFTIW